MNKVSLATRGMQSLCSNRKICRTWGQQKRTKRGINARWTECQLSKHPDNNDTHRERGQCLFLTLVTVEGCKATPHEIKSVRKNGTMRSRAAFVSSTGKLSSRKQDKTEKCVTWTLYSMLKQGRKWIMCKHQWWKLLTPNSIEKLKI